MYVGYYIERIKNNGKYDEYPLDLIAQAEDDPQVSDDEFAELYEEVKDYLY